MFKKTIQNLSIAALLVGLTACGGGNINTPDTPADPSSKKASGGFNKRFFDACLSGDIEKVRTSIRNGMNINAANEEGETCLHAAATSDQGEIASILIANGANMNAATRAGWTPVHSAARFYSYDTISVLGQKGANFLAKTKEGLTGEQMATRMGNKKMAALLKYYANK